MSRRNCSALPSAHILLAAVWGRNWKKAKREKRSWEAVAVVVNGFDTTVDMWLERSNLRSD